MEGSNKVFLKNKINQFKIFHFKVKWNCEKLTNAYKVYVDVYEQPGDVQAVHEQKVFLGKYQLAFDSASMAQWYAYWCTYYIFDSRIAATCLYQMPWICFWMLVLVADVWRWVDPALLLGDQLLSEFYNHKIFIEPF